ncbi:MAG: efflux RND transporter periplasmic adaptor subunit [Patescibacteria group bacterium]
MNTSKETFNVKKKKRKWFLLVLVVVSAVVLAAILFSQKAEDESEEEEAENPSLVKTMKVSSESAESATIKKTAVVKSSNSAVAMAEFSGRISEVRFNTGDYVKKGQVLAVFDQSDSAVPAKASYDSAEESYEINKDNLEETEESTEKSVDLAEKAKDETKKALEKAEKTGDKESIESAKKAYESAKEQEAQAEAQAETQINSAKLQLEQARSQLKQAENQYNKTFIKAPVSGEVYSKNIEEGDYLNTGNSVAEISGEGFLKATIYLNKKEAGGVDVGDEAAMEISGKTIKGEIESLSSVANPGNQRYEAVVKTSEASCELANENAVISLFVDLDSGNGYFIPIDAVNIGRNSNTVFVKEDEKASAREVELGIALGDNVEVLKGLEEGDELVVEGNRNLREGELLKIEN